MSFDVLQQYKVKKVEHLCALLENFHHAEFTGNSEYTSQLIDSLPGHLKLLLPKIREQQSLCAKDDQSLSLLHEELDAVERILKHAEQARLGKTSLSPSTVIGALNIIRARSDTYSRLR